MLFFSNSWSRELTGNKGKEGDGGRAIKVHSWTQTRDIVIHGQCLNPEAASGALCETSSDRFIQPELMTLIEMKVMNKVKMTTASVL